MAEVLQDLNAKKANKENDIRLKLNKTLYSSFLELMILVPQGSILGSLLFNMYLTFSCSLTTTSYVDNTTP